jgi:hypothetical protein
LYRQFQTLTKRFDEVLASTTDPTAYADTIAKRCMFASKLDQITNAIERMRPIQVRNTLCSPSQISEFRSFVFRVRKQVASDALVASVVGRYASMPDTISLTPEQGRWDSGKGEQQLRDLDGVYPFVATSIVGDPKSSD